MPLTSTAIPQHTYRLDTDKHQSLPSLAKLDVTARPGHEEGFCMRDADADVHGLDVALGARKQAAHHLRLQGSLPSSQR